MRAELAAIGDEVQLPCGCWAIVTAYGIHDVACTVSWSVGCREEVQHDVGVVRSCAKDEEVNPRPDPLLPLPVGGFD